MNEELFNTIVAKLSGSGLSEDSVHSLATLLATHYPEHTTVLLSLERNQ